MVSLVITRFTMVSFHRCGGSLYFFDMAACISYCSLHTLSAILKYFFSRLFVYHWNYGLKVKLVHKWRLCYTILNIMSVLPIYRILMFYTVTYSCCKFDLWACRRYWEHILKDLDLFLCLFFSLTLCHTTTKKLLIATHPLPCVGRTLPQLVKGLHTNAIHSHMFWVWTPHHTTSHTSYL